MGGKRNTVTGSEEGAVGIESISSERHLKFCSSDGMTVRSKRTGGFGISWAVAL